MLMNAESDGCCTNSICPLGGKWMGSNSLCLSLFLLISLEKWFLDPCVCCFVTSQTVIIPFVSLLHCCSTHSKCVCRPGWIMMERFWLSYLALVKQQAGRTALPPHGFYRRHRCACYSPEGRSDLHSPETQRSSVHAHGARACCQSFVICRGNVSIFSGKSGRIFKCEQLIGHLTTLTFWKTKVWKASLVVCSPGTLSVCALNMH